MKRGSLQKMYNVVCRTKDCDSAVQVEVKKLHMAVRRLIQAGWTQTRTGWECYNCLQERAKKNDARDGNGKAEKAGSADVAGGECPQPVGENQD